MTVGLPSLDSSGGTGILPVVRRPSLLHVGVGLTVLGLVGCQGNWANGKFTPAKAPAPPINYYSDIDQIITMARTPLIDVDDDDTYEGVNLRVYLYRAADKRPVAGDSAVTFRLYKRIKQMDGAPLDQELKVWNISSEEMLRSLGHDQYGFWCYQLTLYWQGVQVRGPDIFVRAELLRPDQRVITSKAVSLPILGDTVARTVR